MRKIILIFLLAIINNYSHAQNDVKISNKLGTFSVKYIGTGDWYTADQQAKRIGYRLPVIKELYAILMQTPGNHQLWKYLREEGYIIGKTGGWWFWTSKKSDETWSDFANNTKALGMRFGTNNDDPYAQKVYDGESILSDRSSEYGNILVVKKLK